MSKGAEQKCSTKGDDGEGKSSKHSAEERAVVEDDLKFAAVRQKAGIIFNLRIINGSMSLSFICSVIAVAREHEFCLQFTRRRRD